MVHTSAKSFGQVYVPSINWIVMVGVLTLVFSFRSSSALAYAFGMAVTGTITITTTLFLYIAHTRWKTPLWVVLIGGGALIGVNLLFLAANLTKLVHGAWLPLLIAIVTFTIMRTWERGRVIATAARDEAEGHCRRSSTRSPSTRLRWRWCRAPRSSSTEARKPRRWRCATTSSTTKCATNT